MPADLAPLAQRLVDLAAAAQAEQDGNPGATERVLREYREDARVVAAAVLRALVPPKGNADRSTLELPGFGRIGLGELIVAVEAVEVPSRSR